MPGARAEARWPWLLPLFESKNVFFKEAKMVKTGTEFIIRDTEQCMGEHRGKQFFINSEAGQRCTPREKGIGILSNEGKAVKSSRQRHTQRKV